MACTPVSMLDTQLGASQGFSSTVKIIIIMLKMRENR
jgi:hypothetical protein